MLFIQGFRNRVGCSEFHFFGDCFCSAIKCPPKDPRKAKYIVDLVRVITSTRCNHCSNRPGILRKNLRIGIRHGKDDSVLLHISDVFSIQDIRCGNPDKNICTFENLFQRSLFLIRVGVISKPSFTLIDISPLIMNGPFTVTSDQIFDSQMHDHF